MFKLLVLLFVVSDYFFEMVFLLVNDDGNGGFYSFWSDVSEVAGVDFCSMDDDELVPLIILSVRLFLMWDLTLTTTSFLVL